jgi:hypothetical protein
MTQEIKYSFMYNTRHDDGAIVIGKHLYGLPDDSKFVCESYESADWINVGLISINNDDVVIEKKVVTNLESLGGGFKFKYYGLLDEKGNEIALSDHPVLLKWLSSIIKSMEDKKNL